MTSSIGKEIEKIEKAHIARLMYKLIESSKDSDDLSISFHHKNETRERESTENKKKLKKLSSDSL